MAFSLRNMFGKTSQESRPADRVTLFGPRIPRHSSGWSAMFKHLKEGESLRVLDIGPTSPSNINFLTGLGHSLYMADIVTEANRGGWLKPPSEDAAPTNADVKAFFDQHMDFAGRVFEVILLWTTLDYLPESLLIPMVERLHASLKPGGRILAFFHIKTASQESILYRYHVTETDNVEMQEAQRLAVCQIHTNRKIEKLFSAYQSCKFYLAKDNIYEVIITR